MPRVIYTPAAIRPDRYRPVPDLMHLREIIIDFGSNGYIARFGHEKGGDIFIVRIQHQLEDDRLALIFSWCPRKNLIVAVRCRVPLLIGQRKKGKFFMTPQREEANQQAAEKALKAVMCLHGLEFRRTHDLEALAGLLRDIDVAPPVDDSTFVASRPTPLSFVTMTRLST